MNRRSILKLIKGIIGGLILCRLCMLVFGCTSADHAKYIERHCPVERVIGEEADIIIRDRIYYDDQHCYIVGNCWRDAVAISRWAKSKGIICATAPTAARVDGKLITGGHTFVVPRGSAYYLEYVDGQGIVRHRK